ncbi:G protein-activated inward rectifier potassium channel 3-like [Leptidea sinapis]|uniref:G protein-activated inward rectifier potassium channel 3-like n=1 Tax=Leptidea sinapis TaxID=189913 RepID=UPI00213BD8B6|nr:G protein-activated inward rectifier potassium channel 3-like [Leptidea sinapis]
MANNNYESERRGSRNRALERSLSYSEAIGNGSARSSIEIPRIANTEVYTNEELKKHYRISQTYVEGKEIVFPNIVTNVDTTVPMDFGGYVYSSQSSEDEQTDSGLIMTIDVETESPRSSDKRNVSDASTRPLVSSSSPNDTYESIEPDREGIYNEAPSSVFEYSTPYSKRRRAAKRCRRQHGRPMRSRRVVHKSGEENVPVRSNIPSKSMKYMRDIVNTVINSKWRYMILLIMFSHFVFWLLFASIWYVVSASYQEDIGDGKEHCITGTSSFAGMLMMAVETQMTIGYGVRYPNEECPEAIVIMVLEIVAGTALSGGLSSLLFTKLVRPNKLVTSVGFSNKATVCLRDGELCLQFRVWDFLSTHLIGSTINAYLHKPIRTLEGELVPNYIQQLKLCQARALLLWPITVVHVIDAESPLFHMSAEDMMDYRFEIVVCLTGASKSLGTTTQSRTSYLSKEIIWGYRFKNVLKYCKKAEAYTIDVDNLNTVEQVETPLCSASRLKEFEEDMRSEQLLSTIDLSTSPTNLSLSQDETLSRVGESVPSTPVLNRTGTQRSYGWSFKRFYPERFQRSRDVGKQMQELEK